jgi:hypothetical protein
MIAVWPENVAQRDISAYDRALAELSTTARAHGATFHAYPAGAFSAQELRVAAAACNSAAAVRRTIGSFLPDEGPDRVSSEAATLESVAAKLAALAQTMDDNRGADVVAKCSCCERIAPGAPGAGGASHLCNECGRP